MNYWTLCDSSAPGLAGDVYRIPYGEAVTGHRHAYTVEHTSRITGRRSRSVEWTRNPDHPPDPRCPECSAPPPAPEPEPAPRKRISVHVPPENLPRYRRLMNLARHVERIGNTRSNRGDYAGANRAWNRAGTISDAAQTLRVRGPREVRPLSVSRDPVTPADHRPPVDAHEHPPDVPA